MSSIKNYRQKLKVTVTTLMTLVLVVGQVPISIFAEEISNKIDVSENNASGKSQDNVTKSDMSSEQPLDKETDAVNDSDNKKDTTPKATLDVPKEKDVAVDGQSNIPIKDKSISSKERTKKDEKKMKISSKPKQVGNENELRWALLDGEDNIKLTEHIYLKTQLTVNTQFLKIDGGHYSIYGGGTGSVINVSNNTQLVTLSNMAVSTHPYVQQSNPRNGFIFVGTGKTDYILDRVTTGSTSFVGMVRTQGNVVVQNMNHDLTSPFGWNMGKVADNLSFIKARSLVIKDSVFKVDLDGGLLFNTDYNDASFEIDNSTVLINSENPTGNIYFKGANSKVNIRNGSNVTIKNDAAQAKGTNASGMIWSDTANNNQGMTFNVDNSTVNFYSKSMSTIVFGGVKSGFYLNNSIFNIEADEVVDGNNGEYAPIRYKTGESVFKLDQNSKMNILKNGGHSAAVRMVSTGNKILIDGGSYFKVHNKGKPGDKRSNYSQALEYGVGAKDELMEVKGKGSTVEIQSDNGSAVTSRGGLSVSMEPGTTFSAHSNSDNATLNGSWLTWHLNKPKYFDFANIRPGKPIVTNLSNNSELKLTESLLNMWKTGTDISGNPDMRFDIMDLTLGGSNLQNVISSTNSSFNASGYTNMEKISRINANNSAPKINDILLPTDADSAIYVHTQVPEMNDKLRDAFKDEITIAGKFIYPDKSQKSFLAKSQDVLNIYNKKDQKGYVKIDTPDGKPLPKGTQIKLEQAYRGVGHKTISVDTLPDAATVIGVVPPKPAELDINTVKPGSVKITGKGHPNSKVFVNVNNQRAVGQATVSESGTFTFNLPNALKKDDKVQVFLQDNEPYVQLDDGPITHTQSGNINPNADLIYHDVTFPKATIVEVQGSLSFTSVPNYMDFMSEVSNKNLTLMPQMQSSDLVVKDDRDVTPSWRLSLKSNGKPRSDIRELTKTQWQYTGPNNKVITITDSPSVIETSGQHKSQVVNVSKSWNKNRGLKLYVPIEDQWSGTYKATLTWMLEDVPSNK